MFTTDKTAYIRQFSGYFPLINAVSLTMDHSHSVSLFMDLSCINYGQKLGIQIV